MRTVNPQLHQQLVPEPVEHSSIGMQSNHAVFHRHPMDEGFLVVNEVGVRDPQLVCHAIVQGQVEGNPRVGEALVPPGLLEIHGDGVVLRDTGRKLLAHHRGIDPFTAPCIHHAFFPLRHSGASFVSYSLSDVIDSSFFLCVFVQHRFTTHVI